MQRVFGSIVVILLLLTGTPEAAECFSNLPIGGSFERVRLVSLQGKKTDVWRTNVDANLFFFFRPDQEHTPKFLKEMAELHALEGKRVHLVGIVADNYAKADIEKLLAPLPAPLTILVDPGNKLYGKLGVILTPVVGIADNKGKLLAYEPFREVNLAAVVRARLHYALGEISEAQLQAVLNPKAPNYGGNSSIAKRHVHLGEMLLKMKQVDKAFAEAKKSVDEDPELAAAHGFLALVLAHKGDCSAAMAARQTALAKDADEAHAQEAGRLCGQEPETSGDQPQAGGDMPANDARKAEPQSGAQAKPEKAKPQEGAQANEPEKAKPQDDAQANEPERANKAK